MNALWITTNDACNREQHKGHPKEGREYSRRWRGKRYMVRKQWKGTNLQILLPSTSYCFCFEWHLWRDRLIPDEPGSSLLCLLVSLTVGNSLQLLSTGFTWLASAFPIPHGWGKYEEGNFIILHLSTFWRGILSSSWELIYSGIDNYFIQVILIVSI